MWATLRSRSAVSFFTVLLLALLGHLARQAFLSSDVQFLPPATEGDWIVHPDPAPGYREAVFARRFDLPTPTEHFPVRIAAMQTCRIIVNGETVPTTSNAQWKRALPYDLGPALRVGPNEIRIRVSTPAAPPALLVEGPPSIRSDERWTVVLPPESGVEVQAAVAYRGEAFLRDKPNVFRASPHVYGWAAILVVYALFIVYALLPLRLKPWVRASDVGPKASLWGSGAACIALLLAVGAIQVRNALVYPYVRGFDGVQHLEYVRYVAERWIIPDAKQGWEMSQPPLYYVLGACIYQLFGGTARDAIAVQAVQLISPLATLGTIALSFWMLRILCPGRARMQILGVAVTAFLPMLFYMSPQITNEPMAALVIGAAMCLAMRQVARGDVRWRDAIVIGIACGFALLSKYTGAFVFAAVLGIAALRIATSAGRLRHVGWAAVVVVVTVAISGWLYVRNVARFGTPFIGAWDVRSGFNIVQPPGYRTLTFYDRFGSVLWQESAHSRETSFWDGMYGSMWADSHRVFLQRDEWRETLSSACLWLAILPSVAMLAGFGQAVWHVTTKEWDHPYSVIVITTLLTVTALVSFTMEHPWYSTLKAHWALSLAPCAGVFAALGLETMCQRLGRLRIVLYANLVALGGLVLFTFWYRTR